MSKILNQSHNRDTFFCSFSYMLERAAYYGLRSVLILYLTSEAIGLKAVDIALFMGRGAAALIFAQLIGAVIGDLFNVGKQAMIFGGLLQALGAFCFCIPGDMGLYLGSALVLLGAGLYKSKIAANFGRLHLNKTKILDAAFTIFYLAANVGAFWGIIVLSYVGDKCSWNLAFSLAGGIMLLSVISLLFLKEKLTYETPSSSWINKLNFSYLLSAVLLVTTFWLIKIFPDFRILEIEKELKTSLEMGFLNSSWPAINFGFYVTCSLIVIILWTKYYSSQVFKISMAFVFAGIAIGILNFIPETSMPEYVNFYFLAFILFSLAELHISPTLDTFLTKYANPKYLAIALSLSYLPVQFILYLVGLFEEPLVENSSAGLSISIATAFAIGLSLIAYQIKKHPSKLNNEDRK